MVICVTCSENYGLYLRICRHFISLIRQYLPLTTLASLGNTSRQCQRNLAYSISFFDQLTQHGMHKYAPI